MTETVDRIAEAIYNSQEWEFAPRGQWADLGNGVEIFRIAARAALLALPENVVASAIRFDSQFHTIVEDAGYERWAGDDLSVQLARSVIEALTVGAGGCTHLRSPEDRNRCARCGAKLDDPNPEGARA